MESFVTYFFTSDINEINVHTPSKIINGTYFNKTEAKQAIPAPIRFSKIKELSFIETFLVTFKIYAKSIIVTPIKPNQSVVFISFFIK